MSVGVTVVMPVRGRSRALTMCVDTLTRQWPPDLQGEIIVVDDGSGSDFDEPFTDMARPVRVLSLPSQSGPATARNEGVRHAQHDWIAFLDDDCLVPWGWRAHVEQIIDRDAEPRLIAGGIRATSPSNWLAQATEDFVLTPVFEDGHWHVVTAHAVVHREAWRLLGGFDERFRLAGGEDWDFSKRAAALGLRIDHEPGLYLYHRHPVRPREFYERARRYGSSSWMLREIHSDPPHLPSPVPLPPPRGIRRVSRAARAGYAASVRLAWRTFHAAMKPAFFRRRYKEARASGVGAARALRSVVLYASFVAVYDYSYWREKRRAPRASTCHVAERSVTT